MIYIGHLPYGLGESGLRDYFSQYGPVTRVKVMRSKKTARSKGYGFVEFDDREVAAIAAESMNGYLLYGTFLEVRLLSPEEVHDNLFVRANKKFKFIPWGLIYKKKMNKVSRNDYGLFSLSFHADLVEIWSVC